MDNNNNSKNNNTADKDKSKIFIIIGCVFFGIIILALASSPNSLLAQIVNQNLSTLFWGGLIFLSIGLYKRHKKKKKLTNQNSSNNNATNTAATAPKVVAVVKETTTDNAPVTEAKTNDNEIKNEIEETK